MIMIKNSTQDNQQSQNLEGINKETDNKITVSSENKRNIETKDGSNSQKDVDGNNVYLSLLVFSSHSYSSY
ncbi:hypothetical protein KM1_080560 [Entamoeba histolytica HM-3:IMSS]|uniref:Uncharacterized protein n=1 Tax=Entamoeba histolytica HM-3:IMSS TaxID=885315 RepID=M7W2Y2_ENTHI|nr:hypothetical protein KM1_080560 [Entamoeba histolytica HM-3:IMSS]